MTTITDRALLLKRIFLLDAATCAASFALLVGAADALAPLAGLGEGFLRGAGWLLLPCAVLFAWLGTRALPPRAICWIAILGNLLWAGESFATIGLAADTLTPFGAGFVAVQALAVLGLTALEIAGVRRMIRRTA